MNCFFIIKKKAFKLMEDMRVYITNLARYNEGELVGELFTLSIDF